MPPLLLTAQDSSGHIHLIIGANSLASARCNKSIEVGAKAKVIARADAEVHYALRKKIDDGCVEWIQKEFEDPDLIRLGRKEIDHVVDAVFVTVGEGDAQCGHISRLCRRLRIPVNVTDMPNLCTFSLLSTYSDGPLQIGITTSGRGCKLASRIRREIISCLPPDLGSAVERLGSMRRRIWEEDRRFDEINPENDDDDATAQKPSFNQLITDSDYSAAKTRRMRWLSQICEYWPLRRLVSITDVDIDNILQSYTSTNPKIPSSSTTAPPALPCSKGQIILAGSGPGSPALLTLATQRAIKTASLILADKLVPSPVLNLIPRRTPVHIARKFPGNADAAQAEFLALGLEALQKGHTVLRLKQGDPYLYGRGAEEYAYFKENGFTPVVLPGITSALSAPLFAGIPPTHRSVADQVLICTGTGRKGVAPAPPPYVPTQTVVFLMALHRLPSLIASLTQCPERSSSLSPHSSSPLSSSLSLSSSSPPPNPPAWPPSTPCAVIERASCPDQRVIRTSLQHVCAAVEELGSRPPGLLVVSASCGVLHSSSEEEAAAAVKWVVEEGFQGFGALDREWGWEWELDDVVSGDGGGGGDVVQANVNADADADADADAKQNEPQGSFEEKKSPE